jgi:hypothetical protein
MLPRAWLELGTASWRKGAGAAVRHPAPAAPPAHLCRVVHGPCCQGGGVGVEGEAHNLHLMACTQPARAAGDTHEQYSERQPPARAWLQQPWCTARLAWCGHTRDPLTAQDNSSTTQQLDNCTLLTSQLLAALPAVHIPQPSCFVKAAGCHPVPVWCVESNCIHLDTIAEQAV